MLNEGNDIHTNENICVFVCFQRRHPSKMKAFIDCVATRKRTSDSEPQEVVAKQVKLDEMMAAGVGRRVPQSKLDKLVMAFICDGHHALSVVEQPAFKDLITMVDAW